MIKRLTLIFLLATSVASAAPQIDVYNYTVDSSTSSDFSTITTGNPRWNLALTNTNGRVVHYMSGWPSSNRIFRYGSMPSTSMSWLQTLNGSTAYDILNHAHITTTSDFDTVIIGKTASPNGRYLRGYSDNGASTLVQNWSWQWPAYTGVNADANWFVAGAFQVGNHDGSNDTMIAIGRGGQPEHPKYAISTDGGRNWGDTIQVPSNASPFPRTGMDDGQGRIGGVAYNGTAAIIYNYTKSSADSFSTIWWEWNRATKVWDDIGHPLDRSGSAHAVGTRQWYRAFAANAIGTKRFVVHVLDDYNGIDSILYAYRSPGDADWTRGGFQTSSVQADNNFPYVALTYIQSSGRLVLFYTRDNSTSSQDRNLYMRYWDNTNNVFSSEVRVSRYPRVLKVTTAQIVPTAHGDVCYVMFDGQANGRYYAEGAKVVFTELNQTVITSLPYTISTSNWSYVLNADLSSASDGILIADGVHDVVIDGQGHTISFGTAGTTYSTLSTNTGPYGIRTSTGTPSYNITIRNLKVWHTPPRVIWTDPTLISRAVAFRWGAGGTHGYNIENCDFKVVGRNTIIMYGDNSSSVVGRGHYNNYMLNCIWRDSCAAWLRRDYWAEQTMINLTGNNYGKSRNADMEYHWKFEGCSTAVAYWSNVHLEGDSTVAIFENNAWQTDGWNQLYGTPLAAAQGTYEQYVTATENYCIALRQGVGTGPMYNGTTPNPDRCDEAFADGVRIKINNNRFRAGTEKSGGRGIFISGVEGINWNFEDSCISITNNDFTLHQGFDGASTTHKAIICREGFGRIRITGNTIDIPVYYGTPPSSAYGPGPSHGIEITANPGYETLIKGNTIRVYFADAFTHSPIYSDPGAMPFAFIETWMDSLSRPFPELNADGVPLYCQGVPNNQYAFVHNIITDSNYLVTNHIFYRYGSSNGPGGDPVTRGDTLAWYDNGTGAVPNNSNFYIVWKDYATDPVSAPDGALHSYGTFLTDPVVLSGINELRYNISETRPRMYSHGAKATLAVTVRSSTNQPVSGATVTIVDRYGLTKASGTTDGSGVFSYTLPYYQQFGGTIGTTPDSTYNPYVVQASYISAGTATTNHTLTSTNKAVTLYLGSVPETPAEPRTKITGGVHISGGVIIP